MKEKGRKKRKEGRKERAVGERKKGMAVKILRSFVSL